MSARPEHTAVGTAAHASTQPEVTRAVAQAPGLEPTVPLVKMVLFHFFLIYTDLS